MTQNIITTLLAKTAKSILGALSKKINAINIPLQSPRSSPLAIFGCDFMHVSILEKVILDYNGRKSS